MPIQDTENQRSGSDAAASKFYEITGEVLKCEAPIEQEATMVTERNNPSVPARANVIYHRNWDIDQKQNTQARANLLISMWNAGQEGCGCKMTPLSWQRANWSHPKLPLNRRTTNTRAGVSISHRWLMCSYFINELIWGAKCWPGYTGEDVDDARLTQQMGTIKNTPGWSDDNNNNNTTRPAAAASNRPTISMLLVLI